MTSALRLPFLHSCPQLQPCSTGGGIIIIITTSTTTTTTTTTTSSSSASSLQPSPPPLLPPLSQQPATPSPAPSTFPLPSWPFPTPTRNSLLISRTCLRPHGIRFLRPPLLSSFVTAMTRPRKDVKFQHRSASNGRARRPSQSMSDISENGSDHPSSPKQNGAVAPPVNPPTRHVRSLF